MPQIIFVEHDNTKHEVQAEPGQNLMQVALDNFVPGIDGDCGGACACGTCHVFVEDAWSEKLGAASCEEEGMLGLKPEKSETSRLACQIDITDQLEGLVVRLPEFQM
jgi:2Fe-2S ferredoxin